MAAEDPVITEGRGIIEIAVKALVDDPDQVEIENSLGGPTVLFTINVAKEDIGKVIGRGGRNIGFLRGLVSAFGAKHNRRIIIEVKQ
jgi:predicted RNA-binding protein YlqC (UPF0109 family)